MKKIAIITGATGGLGSEFVRLMKNENLDEIWAIARNNQKLHNLKKEIGDKLVIISKDLTVRDEIHSLKELLLNNKVEIKYLINNAGIGKMAAFEDFSQSEVEKTLDINCNATTCMCSMCLPYMQNGSIILNISSQASFQPDPYLTMYAATKAFVTSYSRALNRELKKRGITVTAVCPGWVDTELLLKEYNGVKVKFPGIVKAKPVAEKAIKDAKFRKDISVYGAYVKCMQLFSKIFPHKEDISS